MTQFHLCPGQLGPKGNLGANPQEGGSRRLDPNSAVDPTQPALPAGEPQPLSLLGLSGRPAGSPSGIVGFEWSQVENWLGSSAPSQRTSTSMTRKHQHHPPTPTSLPSCSVWEGEEEKQVHIPSTKEREGPMREGNSGPGVEIPSKNRLLYCRLLILLSGTWAGRGLPEQARSVCTCISTC